MEHSSALERRIRVWLAIFIVGLVLSGLTAFPLVHELRWVESLLKSDASPVPGHFPALMEWISRAREGLEATDEKYPFILYGTDWLAFAHLVIAVAFYGPFRDPVRNIWMIEFGMIACVGVIPLALICGPIRGIPLYWQFIDMSFGVIGIIPLYLLRRMIKRLEALSSAGSEPAESTPPESPPLAAA
ncbi:hypothetical protein QMK19_40415 [Streptomyces sp. H10-C2]|uniref:hypothetical protein n=1 Tax=unclassified Streptomyces TaxID=2593676 RepID=UPI0024B8E834|nr:MULTISPECIES: hypothetical protein [unclassified Streptomyces]MDJ0347445.1 hypothetical protein [Streptomyces sp. PH10-H1]MDJ0375673.1 hypothetical protein [Streptomyces sp. H10-C2]